MKKTSIRILTISTFASILCICSYLYIAYLDYTCRGCMTVPDFEDSKNNHALRAIYRSNDRLIADTLFLSKALIHGNGYQFYSDEYFPGITGKLKNRIKEVKSDRHLTSYVNSMNSGYGSGLQIIPETITCHDSSGLVVATFKLYQEFPENDAKSQGRLYIREWKTILKQYNNLWL